MKYLAGDHTGFGGARHGSSEIRALLALAGGATFISFSAVIVRLSNTGSATQGFYRVLLGGVILLALAATQVRRGGWRIAPRRVAWLLVAGCFLRWTCSFGT